MRDSFIIYRSFFDAISDLPKDQQADVYNAICAFSLDQKEPELSGVSSTIFKLIRPQLEANYKRYENGKQPKTKPEKSKPEAKIKQKESKTEANKNVNDNVNDNNNVKVNVNIVPTLKEFGEYALSQKNNLDKESVSLKYKAWVENGWKDGNNKVIKNWKSKLLQTIPHLKESTPQDNPNRGGSPNKKAL